MENENDALTAGLRRLDAAPPDGLLERCLGTVPPAPATTPATRKRGTIMKPMIAAAVAATACLLASLPALQGGKERTHALLAPAPAFAATEEAMRHVDRWHMTDRALTGVSEDKFRKGKWFEQRWWTSDTWFDADRGVLFEVADDPEAPLSERNTARYGSLELANGERHRRDWYAPAERMRVLIDENPAKWDFLRAHEMGKVTSAQALAQTALMRVAAGHLKRREIAYLKAQITPLPDDAGRKTGKFTFLVQQKEPLNLPRAIPKIRLVIQTDPESKRIRRAEQYLVGRDDAEPVLFGVQTFEYTDIPAEKFDAEAFAQGAVVERW